MDKRGTTAACSDCDWKTTAEFLKMKYLTIVDSGVDELAVHDGAVPRAGSSISDQVQGQARCHQARQNLLQGGPQIAVWTLLAREIRHAGANQRKIVNY